MTMQEQIEYSVLTFGHGDWQEQGKATDMQSAMRMADHIVASRRFERVKVDKHFHDGTNNRFVTATIFEKTRARAGLGIGWLLALAAFGGCTAFLLTYGLIRALS